ncbi:adenylate kinase family protein [Halobacterium sp. KA-6]|jgi:adenylate kinase|uniref:adenylate kinase family protein n=1 Tax=Halobacterium sp. KA-6 TaxID=2896368 RepID=UPI001E37171E|nr:adenylate kinase family protein [Halobacterium sp. KA-6]MCD2202662.1 adenylate kinase family protein [Halobacterium sp. KA-6]
MRVAVTGTPGTGKTTATEHLDTDLDIVHLNDVIQEEGLYTEVDEARDSKVADLDAVRDWLEGREDVLVESHLSHLLDADRVVVLRCAPGELERRLIERGEPAEKAQENAESEALDVILSEAVRDHGKPNVYEIDTTGRDPEAVADDIEAVLAGERDPSAGEVDFTEYL